MVTIVYEKLKFKKTLFGGYNKASVKKQFEEVEREYSGLLEEERNKYKEMIEEKDREIASLIKRK